MSSVTSVGGLESAVSRCILNEARPRSPYQWGEPESLTPQEALCQV